MMRTFLGWSVVVAAFLVCTVRPVGQDRPNIVVIMTDDLGYGDVSAYGATALQTPNIDQLARAGLRFTDAHSSAATCTPSRYSLLTGEYAWRKAGTGVLPGDAALIVDPSRLTLPAILRRGGYTTGIVGKWHLGLGGQGGPDWNADVTPGPNDVGFDYSFIMAATGDRVPTVFIENRRVVGAVAVDPIAVSYTSPVGDWPTGRDHPELLTMHPSHGHDQTIVNGISRIGYMHGGRAALWKDEDMADTFTGKAVSFIESHRNGPFFLYFATHDPHVPRVPHPRFAGKTTMGPRGDAIVEADWSTGEILRTLDRLNLARNTLVIFTSDNGPVIDDGYKDDAVAKLGTHKPAGPFRGGKYSNFEGGTRIPLIVRWPDHVAAGTSMALVSQVDFFASFAALVGQALGAGEAPDSANILPALLGTSQKARTELVEEAGALSLRQGAWKYVPPNNKAKINANTNTELGNDTVAQLYDLSTDPGETKNVADTFPDRVTSMRAALERVKNTRTR
jgi:arylsulfatase A-like enzyme